MENTTQLNPLWVACPESSVDTGTSDQEGSLQGGLIILSVVIYSTACLLGVIGNGLVIFITGFRMKKTVNTIWFLNLAIADFTFTFFLPLEIASLAWDLHWPFGEAMCKVSITMAYVTCNASIYLLMVISIDRCISVVAPVWAQNHRNPRYASFMAFGVWILALVLSMPVFHFRTTKKLEQNENVIHCYFNYSHDEKKARVTHRAMVISDFILAFMIPFLVIIICYGAIVWRLRRDRLARSSKPFKVITAVIVAFFVCFSPFQIFAYLEIQAYKDSTLCPLLNIGIPLATSLIYINSCLNPILYVFMAHDFKKRLNCSIPLLFEMAFAEEEGQSLKQTKTKSSEDGDCSGL